MKVIVKRRISMICAMIMLISSVLGHSMGVFAADETENSEENLAIEWTVSSSWNGGYVASLTIKNISNTDIMDWQITFNSKDEITTLWGGICSSELVNSETPDEDDIENTQSENEIIEVEEYYCYTINAEAYNSVIKAGESVTIGYLANGNDQNIWNESCTCNIYESPNNNQSNTTSQNNSTSENNTSSQNNTSSNTEYSTGEGFPYAIFANSNKDGAITTTADNFFVNGNVMTNGTLVSPGTININGNLAENSDEDMIYIFGKIEDAYFSDDNYVTYSYDYIKTANIINVDTPTDVMGNVNLTGNVNVNSVLSAFGSIILNCEVINEDNGIIFSKYGSIIIDSNNVSLTGLVYAPFGTVKIVADNLNVNGAVIIADRVILDCPNVNFYYGTDAGEFVGTQSEEFDGVPYEALGYLADDDNDGLPNLLEEGLGSDSDNEDTDGDGLPDGYEVFTLGTDPVLTDSDSNGITDDLEDYDEDELGNLDEYIYGTHSSMRDSDGDGLSDGEEILTYYTDPLCVDTDGEGLVDGDDVVLGFSPLLQDTDGNGILDCDEKIQQEYSYETYNDTKISEIILDLNATGNLQNTVYVEDIMDRDMMSSGVAGLVGNPYDISTSSTFDPGTLSFKINIDELGDIDPENLTVMWYDETNDNYVIMDSTWDDTNCVISTEVTHFSRYMIVDKVAWFEAWKQELDYLADAEGNKGIYTVLAVDCSDSMRGNDRISVINPSSSQPYKVNDCYRYRSAYNFIQMMDEDDKIGVITFEDTATRVSGLTDNKTKLYKAISGFYNRGGTSFDAPLLEAYSVLSSQENADVSKQIILLSDGNAYASQDVLDLLKLEGIRVYTIGLGIGTLSLELDNIAKSTGGLFFKAKKAEDLIEIYEKIDFDPGFDRTDTDGDGLPDVVEAGGIRLCNGQIIYTDPVDSDSDGDGLLDGEEINPSIKYIEYVDLALKNETGWYYQMKSDPNSIDSDGDLFPDNKIDGIDLTGYYQYSDPNPLYSDVKIVDLGEYLSINYIQPEGASIGWTGNTPEDGNSSYGGAQAWFGKAGGTENDTGYGINSVSGQCIREIGCGVVAAADYFLYRAIKDKYIQSEYMNFLGARFQIGDCLQNIDFIIYMNYEKYISKYFYISRLDFINGVPGTFLPGSLDFGMCQISIDLGMNDIFSWGVPYYFDNNLVKKEICTKISQKKPVVFSYNNADGLKLYKYDESSMSFVQEENSVYSHYMICTGIIEFSDDVIRETEYHNMLHISSAGREYYIDFDFYLSKMDLCTNIMMDY